MKTILYIKNTEIQALQIQGKTQSFVTYELHPGTVVNGVVLRPDQLGETLSQMNPKPKSVTLVLDSSNIMAKKLSLPKVPKSKLQQIVKGEFDGFQGEQTYQFDANVLQDGSPMTVLGYAAPQDLVERYLQVCKTCGIHVERVDFLLNGLVNYVTKRQEFQGKTFLFNVISGDNMIAILFVNGVYKLANRVRLLQVGEGELFTQELYNRLSSMVQFATSERSEQAIADSYYVGLSPEELTGLGHYIDGILPVNVHNFVDATMDMTTFYPALATFAGKQDINFAVNSEKKNEKKSQLKGHAAKAVILLILLGLVGAHAIVLLVNHSAAVLVHDTLEAQVNSAETAEKMELYDKLQLENTQLNQEYKTMNNLFTMLESGSQVEKEVLTHIFDGNHVDNFSYEFTSGAVTVQGAFPTNKEATQYAESLRNRGFFVTMNYQGYQMAETPGFLDQENQWYEGESYYRFDITAGYNPISLPAEEVATHE